MRKRVLGALSVAVCSTFLVAGTALAGGPTDPLGGEHKLGAVGGLRYLSESLLVGSSGHFTGAYEAADIACGAHSSAWKPAGGGSFVSGSPDKNFIASYRPMDLDGTWESPDDTVPDDWWESTVHAVLNRKLTGYAICTKKPLRYVQTTAPTGASSDRTGSASCPAHTVLVGGGSFIATSDSFVNASFPGKNNTWQARVFDTVGGAGGMSTFAICRKATGVATVVKAVKGIAHGKAAFAVARCPDDRHVMGGGGKWTGSIAAAHLADSFPVDGPDRGTVPDDGWKVIGYNSSGTKKALSAFAKCVKSG